MPPPSSASVLSIPRDVPRAARETQATRFRLLPLVLTLGVWSLVLGLGAAALLISFVQLIGAW